MNWPHDNDAELDAFYSRPDGSAKWEVTNLTYIFPPWKAYLAGTSIELVHGIRVHKKVAESLTRIFNALWEQCGKSQAEIEKLDLHQIGGAYFFRARRGSRRLSNHARGIAIDIDPQDNQMRPGNKGDMSMTVISAFEKEGWRWGGVYGDPMHFEAVDNGKPNPGAVIVRFPKTLDVLAKGSSVAILNPFVANDATLAIIKPEEKFMATVYDDRGAPAIGYGHRILPGEKFTTISEPEAHEILLTDLRRVWAWLGPLIKVRLTPNQTGALLGWAMNNKPVNVINSTLLKLLNSADPMGAAKQFEMWVKSTNPVTKQRETLPGLVRRNKKLKQLFLTP